MKQYTVHLATATESTEHLFTKEQVEEIKKESYTKGVEDAKQAIILLGEKIKKHPDINDKPDYFSYLSFMNASNMILKTIEQLKEQQ